MGSQKPEDVIKEQVSVPDLQIGNPYLYRVVVFHGYNFRRIYEGKEPIIAAGFYNRATTGQEENDSVVLYLLEKENARTIIYRRQLK
ncbi:MAG: hypothetical protein HY361_02745 [Candidatus Aenigmarchaeota archaeon]|nr:hypothetical protein [Candidatus Aenigmarchaeota archaeon]